MFDLGWPEFLVILVVALVVIGPRDLPGALRQVGRWVRSARKVAREFQRHVDDALRETELDDLKKGIDATRKFNVKRQIEKFVDPDDELPELDKSTAEKLAAGKPSIDKPAAGKPGLGKPVPQKPAPAQPAPDKPALAKPRSDETGSADPAPETAAPKVVRRPSVRRAGAKAKRAAAEAAAEGGSAPKSAPAGADGGGEAV